LRAPGTKRGRREAPTACARLSGHVALEVRAEGKIVAGFEGHTVGLGTFSAGAAERAQGLHSGLPLASFAAGRRNIDKEIDLLVRRLARSGLLEYCLRRPRNDEDSDEELREDLVVIEPQVPDYWPRTPPLGDADILVLSRFAYLRRRGSEMVLESPRAGAVFKIRDPNIAAALVMLSAPQKIRKLRRHGGFPGIELLALLADCQILFKVPVADTSLRSAEGDDNLVMWDFHDLLFHTRSTEGRHANPVGGTYPHAGAISPLPAVRPRWPGQKIDLGKFSDAVADANAETETNPPFAELLRERHSTRDFDDRHPITLAELSRLLDSAARVLSTAQSRGELGDDGPLVEYAFRPYPSAGASYGLELYLAVDKCDGLARGFYHYDAGAHALVPIDAGSHELEAALTGAASAMGAAAAPQIGSTIAARFGRVSWKYSSIAYALILKDVGVFIQTLYLTATDLGLGCCAIGPTNIDLFAKMTGIDFHIEGPVGQFALGRGVRRETSG
jgi:SagB-type dehydrogenase family enzyme